ncbi:hypothetical protein NPIL_103851 [Nephila pilipes]|uniref:Uncharacterized protein n=1 Tax=Nephila pilipes TaxID=299642 RepID=A0A8X6MT69_NEPPI|nr:hypothetical protein NPIL_103851 [Nephila pilipes]
MEFIIPKIISTPIHPTFNRVFLADIISESSRSTDVSIFWTCDGAPSSNLFLEFPDDMLSVRNQYRLLI